MYNSAARHFLIELQLGVHLGEVLEECLEQFNQVFRVLQAVTSCQ
jgi:hypothetical protein